MEMLGVELKENMSTDQSLRLGVRRLLMKDGQQNKYRSDGWADFLLWCCAGLGIE
jgi:hypothetical protein